MPDPFTLTTGFSLAGPVLRSLFPKQFGGEVPFQGVDPSQFKEGLTLSDTDIMEMMQQIMDDLSGESMAARSDIKQAGAARKLPVGAIQTGLADVTSAVAKGAGKAKVTAKESQRRSLADYINMLNNYKSNKMAWESGQAGGRAGMLQEALGTIAQTLLLKEAGLFGGQKQPALKTSLGGSMGYNSPYEKYNFTNMNKR